MDGVAFVTTVFNKAAFLPRVIDALARQTGQFNREFIFVDDGSSDGSADLISQLTRGWADPVLILRQANRGASAATNAGVARATMPWIKLVDGDDLLVPGATAWLLEAARATGHHFAYGNLGTYEAADPDPLRGPFPKPAYESLSDGLTPLIRNCPLNSSALLVSAARYREVGGCDERLVSADYALILRLSASGGLARLRGALALKPDDAPGRQSETQRRSRYETVLALYYLATETPGLSPGHVGLAYRRALSRAYRFNRSHGGNWVFSRHFWRYVLSKLRIPTDQPKAMYEALGAFTDDGRSERQSTWMPGAMRRGEVRVQIGADVPREFEPDRFRNPDLGRPSLQ